MRAFLIALLLASLIANVTLFLFPYKWENDKFPPTEQGSKQSQENQNGFQPGPTLEIECNPNCTAKNPDQKRNDNSLTRLINQSLEDPTIGLTGGILVANFMLVLVVLAQVRDGRRSSERQLRAYVTSAIGTAIRQWAAKGLRFEFRPILLNTGQTPAYDVHIVSAIRLLSFREAATYDFRLPNVPGSISTLGPRQDRFTQVIFDRVLSRAELQQYLSGQRQLFVFGTITYRDAFRKWRYTNYCYSIAWWNKRTTHLWLSFHRHNDSN
jgi:hypothetical protein